MSVRFLRVMTALLIRTTLFASILLLLVGCAKEEIHEGTVGNYYSVTVEAPFGVKNPEFAWFIARIPHNSTLSFSDLTIKDGGRQMSFQPDQHGEFVFDLVVSTAEGEKAASESYTFLIQPPLPQAETETVAEPEPDTVVSEVVTVEEMEEPQMDTVSTERAESIPEEATVDTEDVVALKNETVTAEEPDAAPQAPKPAAPVRGTKIPKVEGKLTIQISSWPTFEQARLQADELLGLGFDAYLQEAYFEETNEIWYRVRVGTFVNYDNARHAASEISSVANLATWVDHVRTEVQKD